MKLLLLGLLLFGVALSSASAAEPLLLEPEQLQEMLGKENVRIIDVRSSADYGKGHIPGAVHVDVGAWKKLALSEGGFQDQQGWAEKIGAAGISQQTHVVVYGARVSNAARIWWLLKYAGVKDVSLLNGGWGLWSEQKLPVEKKAAKVSAAPFKPQFQADRLAEMDDVKTSLKDKSLKVVDTRSNSEFASGRIPNSAHLEWKHLVAKDGRFKSKAELKELFQKQGIVQADTAVCY